MHRSINGLSTIDNKRGAQVEENSSSPRHYAFRPSSTIPPVHPVQPQHSYEVPSKKTLALVLQACRRTTRPDQPPLPLSPTRIDTRQAITLQSLLKTTAHSRLPTYHGRRYLYLLYAPAWDFVHANQRGRYQTGTTGFRHSHSAASFLWL